MMTRLSCLSRKPMLTLTRWQHWTSGLWPKMTNRTWAWNRILISLRMISRRWVWSIKKTNLLVKNLSNQSHKGNPSEFIKLTEQSYQRRIKRRILISSKPNSWWNWSRLRIWVLFWKIELVRMIPRCRALKLVIIQIGLSMPATSRPQTRAYSRSPRTRSRERSMVSAKKKQ